MLTPFAIFQTTLKFSAFGRRLVFSSSTTRTAGFFICGLAAANGLNPAVGLIATMIGGAGAESGERGSARAGARSLVAWPTWRSSASGDICMADVAAKQYMRARHIAR